MYLPNAWKAAAIKKNEIAWVGRVVYRCEECNADISHAKRVEIKTASQIMRERVG